MNIFTQKRLFFLATLLVIIFSTTPEPAAAESAVTDSACDAEHCGEPEAINILSDALRDIKSIDTAPIGTQFYVRFKGYFIKAAKDGTLAWVTDEEVYEHRESITTFRFILEGEVPKKFKGDEKFRILLCTTVQGDCRPYRTDKQLLELSTVGSWLSYFCRTQHGIVQGGGILFISPKNLLNLRMKKERKSNFNLKKAIHITNYNYDYSVSEELDDLIRKGGVSGKFFFIIALDRFLQGVEPDVNALQNLNYVLKRNGDLRVGKDGRVIPEE